MLSECLKVVFKTRFISVIIVKVYKPKGTSVAIAYLDIDLLLAYAIVTAFETLS